MLRINVNLLDELPACFPALTALEELDLSNNNIRHFPIEISDFKNLKILVVAFNPWENPDDAKKVIQIARTRGAIVHD